MLDEIGGFVVAINFGEADKDVELILTRSIRRKLVLGLAFVFGMVVLLSIAGLSALHAYWRVVHNLRASRDEEPRRADLAAAIRGLNDPLRVRNKKDKKNVDPLGTPITTQEPVVDGRLWFDAELWEDRFQKVDDEHKEYYRRWAYRNSPMQDKNARYVVEQLLQQIRIRLEKLKEDSKKWINTEKRQQALMSMQLDVAELQSLVNDIPDFGSALDLSLRESGSIFGWRLWMIGGATLVVIVLFGCLIYFGNNWILIPIRQLHEAASRVANGDYTYRLKLRGKDEMVELGEMFNKMTARFQTDKAKLAQEVEERSRQILRNERLAGIGYFASGIAHELNNPLQAIGAAAESLNGRLKDGSMGTQLPRDDRELLATYLGMIERESTRCQQITSRVLDFARGTNGPKTRQDLTKIVSEVLEMVTHMRKFDNRKIVFDRSQPHLVDVSAAEMKQVILNLVANGLEAMNGSGTLTIQISETVDEVVLSVQDDGCGMTANVIQNLYEPFFTEKQNGKGTGLGLSITHRIVGDHGGRIEATSEGPGRGSTFLVHLPRCCKASQVAAA